MRAFRVWHISDTHCLHNNLIIPPDVDMVIHSGDCSNSRDPARNSNEVISFLDWFANLPIEYRIFVAGNHDVSIERRLITPSYINDLGIIYLENDSANIAGLNIWGSPITPSFGRGWAWNVARHKTKMVWDLIPDDTDIVITHGPPKRILDLSLDRENKLEFCGCESLFTRLIELEPTFSCFGHIHDSKKMKNSGLKKMGSCSTMFSNGSAVCDGKMQVVNHGNILEYVE